MKINHIGIVVKDIDKSIFLYRKMGYVLQDCVINDFNQQNKIAFLYLDCNHCIELIEPLSNKSTVINCEVGYHHICYEQEQGEDLISSFKSLNIGKIFTSPICAPALNDRSVYFACLRNGLLVEFLI